jgi:hypothetical protein
VQSEDRWQADRGGEGLVSGHRKSFVAVVGEKPPVMSIAWEPPVAKADSGFSVIYSEFDPELGEDDPTPTFPVCLGCLLEDGDEQLGVGLDLARQHGQADWDVEACEWFVPWKVGDRER